MVGKRNHAMFLDFPHFLLRLAMRLVTARYGAYAAPVELVTERRHGRYAKLKVTAQIRGMGRQDESLEQLVAWLSLEAGVTAVSWAVGAQTIE
jgi:hypothetical protein